MQHSTPLPIDPIAEAKRQWIEHGWHEAAGGMAAVTSIMRAQQIVLMRVEAELKPYALTFARFELLRLLGFSRGGGLPMSSASARLQVHPTSVTNTVDRLERDGLVRRIAHPTDGRAVIVELTNEGRAALERATTALNDGVFSQPGLDPADLSTLVGVLARFRRDAGDFEVPPPPPDPL